MATLPLRQIEGKYEILEKIKEGGMGAIYKVRHRLLEEIRVVKVMRPQIADSEELQQRFAREARAAIRLKHPNIAQLYDFSVEADGIAYMVMEFIDGVTLQEMLAKNGPAPLDLTLEMARQGLEALRYLHAHGYVHRDVAPDNLMLTKDFAGQPHIKLIDLGIVKHLAGAAEGLTATGMFLGKVRYSSPEQFSGEKGGLDQRSDLYSFGVMLYELLTGKCPIVGENLSQLVAAHLFQPPLSFDVTDPEGRVPEEIRATVMRTLVKAPADRIASAQELQEALARHPKAQNLSKDLETTLAITIQSRTVIEQAPRGTTQGRLDEQFGLSKTPGPGAGLRAADAISPASAGEQLAKLLTTAQQLAQERRWEEARLALYQALGIDPDHSEIRELLATVETSHQQAIAEEKRRQAIAQAVGRVEACLTEERPDDASSELERARAEYGYATELSGLDGRIAVLRAALAERARRAEIDEAVAHITSLLNAEQAENAATSLQEAEKRFGNEAPFASLRTRLVDLTRRLEERRREQEAAARRERIQALLGEAAELAATKAFADAIARAEQAVALDPNDTDAQQALQEYRTSEASRREEIRRQHALDQAAAKIESLLQGKQLEAAGRELEAAIAAFGSDQRLEQLRSRFEALRRELEERARERQRQKAIAAAVSAVESHLTRESPDEAESALQEAAERLGADARFDALAERIALQRTDLAERERQRELEQQRLLEQQEERRKREEERRRLEAEARRKEEERREREAAEARQREEENRLREEAEARRKEEERRLREAAEARKKEEERRLREEAEARQREEERRLRAEAEARRKEEEARRKEEEARRKEEERRLREEAEARRREAAALLQAAGKHADHGNLGQAVETARRALELDPEPARAAILQYERALEAEARLRRLDELLAAAKAEIGAGDFESALRRLEGGRREHGEDPAWQQLVSRTQAGIEQQRAEREHQRAVEAEAAAVGKLIDKGRLDRAEKRLQKAHADLGEADVFVELRGRLQSSRRQEEQSSRSTTAVAQEQSSAESAPGPKIKPAFLAAAAGVALVVALAAWSVSWLRSDRPAASSPAPESVVGEAVALDSGTRPVPGAPLAESPSSAGEAEAALVPTRSSGGSLEENRENGAEPPDAGRDTADREEVEVAQAPPPARDLDRRSEPAQRGATSPVVEPRVQREAARPDSSRPNPTAAPPPETRPARPVEEAPARANERSGEADAAAQLPVEELPAAKPQPTRAAVPPPPPEPEPVRQAEAPPPAMPPSPAADERGELLATLGRYRAAYESLDADAVARVFTGADARELRRVFRQYKSMSLQIGLAGCQTAVDGERATVACDVTRVIDPKAGERVSRSQRETFQLRKTGQTWVVEAVR